MRDVLQLPHFQQSAPGSCLPACVRMVLAYLGLERTEAEVGRILGAREYGTPSFAVQRLAVLGLRVVYGVWSIPQLLSALDAGQPVILFVRTGFLDYWQEDVAHAIVVVGVTEDQQFWLHDPAFPIGPLIASWDGLLAAWAEFSYRGAALSRGN